MLQLAEKLSVSIHHKKVEEISVNLYKKFGRSIRFSYDEVLSALRLEIIDEIYRWEILPSKTETGSFRVKFFDENKE